MAYVETANLDGETNLKIKQCAEETARLPSDAALAAALRGRGVAVECEPPNSFIYRYAGVLVWDGKRVPLSPVQVRGWGKDGRGRERETTTQKNHHHPFPSKSSCCAAASCATRRG